MSLLDDFAANLGKVYAESLEEPEKPDEPDEDEMAMMHPDGRRKYQRNFYRPYPGERRDD